MLRTILLTMQNEARLLWKDPVAIPMLVLAPIVIIVVAGYSLGNIYGRNANAFVLPIVDHDRGEVAAGIIDGLRREPSLRLEMLDNVDEARRIVSGSDRAPVAIRSRRHQRSDRRRRPGSPDSVRRSRRTDREQFD